MSSTTNPPLSSSPHPPGVITVLPGEEGPAEWFEKNPILTIALAVAFIVLILGLLFWLFRKWWKKKKKSSSNIEAPTEDGKSTLSKSLSQPRPSQTETMVSVPIPDFMFSSDQENRTSVTTLSGTGARSSNPDIRGESFIIIGSPCNTNPRNQTRRYHKTKRKSMAMPPGFYVSNRRKSAPSIAPENELRPPRISFARWSTAGLEIQTTDLDKLRARASSVSSESKKRSLSNENINVLKVPFALRRVSQGQDHIIYATEPLKSPRGSTQIEPDEEN